MSADHRKPDPHSDWRALVWDVRQYSKAAQAYLGISAHNTDPNPVQAHYHWGEPDGSESAYTAYSEDTALTLFNDGLGDYYLFLRIDVTQDANCDQNLSETYRLQYNLNGTGWNNVLATGSSEPVLTVTDSDVTDGGATSERITTSGNTFLAGEIIAGTDGIFDAITWPSGGGDHSEFLASLVLQDANLADGDYLEFRLYDQGDGQTLTGGYTVTPRVDWDAPGTITQADFRIRSPVDQIDEGGVGINATTGWEAALNTDVTADFYERVFRIRFNLEAPAGAPGAAQFEPWYRIDTGGGYGAWAVVPNGSDVYGYGTWDRGVFQAAICNHISAATGYTDGAATSQIMGGTGTFTAGEVRETEPTGSITIPASGCTEIEWSFLIRKIGNDYVLNDGAKIQIQIRHSDGTQLDAYTNTPTITLDSTEGIIGGCRVESPGMDLVVTPSGTYYVLIEYVDYESGTQNYENMPAICKSTDGGVTWTVLDIGGGPLANMRDLEGGAIVLDEDDDRILVIAQGASSGNSDAVTYGEFATEDAASNPDTWLIVTGGTDYEQAIDDTVDLANSACFDAEFCFIEYRPNDGTVWALYHDEDGTYSQATLRKRSAVGGSGTWGSAIEVDDTASTEFIPWAMVKDSTGRLHIFYMDWTNNALYHKSLSTSDVLSSRTNVASTLTLYEEVGSPICSRSHGMSMPKVFFDGATEKVALIVAEDQHDLYYIESPVSSISWSTPQLINDNSSTNDVVWSQGDGYQPCVDLVIHPGNGDRYAYWGADATGSIKHPMLRDIRSSGSWGTDSTVVNPLTTLGSINFLRAVSCIRAERYRFGIFYEETPEGASGDGGTGGGKFLEVDLGAVPVAADQAGFRIRSSGGQQDASGVDPNSNTGWAAALNTNYTGDMYDQEFRIRFLIENTGGSVTDGFQLRYQKNGTGGYSLVPSSTDPWIAGATGGQPEVACVPSNATNFTNGVALTGDYLGSALTRAGNGEGCEDNTTGSFTIAMDEFIEVEFVILIRKGSEDGYLEDTDYLEFRLYYDDGTALDSYAVTPRITLQSSTRNQIGACFPETPNGLLWIRDKSGNIYALTEISDIAAGSPYANNHFIVKSTDNGKTWTAPDLSNLLTTWNETDFEAGCMVYDSANDEIVCFIQGGNSGAYRAIFYAEDHPTLGDTYGTKTLGITTNSSGTPGLGQGCAGVRRTETDDDDFIFANCNTTQDARYAQDSGSGFSGETTIDGAATDMTDINAVVQDSTGRIHVIYVESSGAGDASDDALLWHKSISTADVLSARTAVQGSVALNNDANYRKIATCKVFMDGATEKISVVFHDTNDNLYYTESPVSSISFTTPVQINDQTSVGEHQGGSDASMHDHGCYGADQYVAYGRPDGAVTNLYLAKREGGTWGTDASIVTFESEGNWAMVDIYVRDAAVYLGVLYDDHPDGGGTGGGRWHEEYIAVATQDVDIPVPKASLTLTAYAPTVDITEDIWVPVPKASLTLTAYAPTAIAPNTIPVPKASLTLTAYVPTVDITEDVWIAVPKAALSLTAYAPTVIAPNTIPVPKASLTLTAYAPTVDIAADVTIPVPKAALSLTAYAPTVDITADIWIDVPKASLSLTAYAPTVDIEANIWIDVPKASLSLTGYAPTVDIEANIWIDVPKASLTLTGYAPSVLISVVIAVPKASLSLTSYAPTVALGPYSIPVPKASLTLTAYAPTVVTGGNLFIDVPKASLSLTGYAPTVDITADIWVPVPKAALSLTGYAPTVVITADIWVPVPKAALSLTGYAPTVAITADIWVPVPKASLTLTAYAPTVVLGNDVVVEVPAASLVLTGYAPTVIAPVTVPVPKASLTLTAYAPTVILAVVIPVPKASLTLTAYAPSIALGPYSIPVPKAALVLTGYAPFVLAGDDIAIPVPKASLTLTAYAPTVFTPLGIPVPKASLTLTGYAPLVIIPVIVPVPKAALVLTAYEPLVVRAGPTIFYYGTPQSGLWGSLAGGEWGGDLTSPGATGDLVKL